eukprot:COSAG06_NODE_16655_length_988_cov_1.943757_1_plen_161_part_00
MVPSLSERVARSVVLPQSINCLRTCCGRVQRCPAALEALARQPLKNFQAAGAQPGRPLRATALWRRFVFAAVRTGCLPLLAPFLLGARQKRTPEETNAGNSQPNLDRPTATGTDRQTDTTVGIIIICQHDGSKQRAQSQQLLQRNKRRRLQNTIEEMRVV